MLELLTIGAVTLLAGATAQPLEGVDWREQETHLRDAMQLTTRDRFLKAGEAYFSPDGRWVIFQAVVAPPKGAAPDPAAGYSMYVARLERESLGDGKWGAVRGLGTPVKVSPEGSINTCGWFHPTIPGRAIFGSTLTAPTPSEKPGFQVGTNRYVWAFPDEMEVVETWVSPVFEEDFARRQENARRNNFAVDRAPTLDTTPKPIFARPGYDAECSYSPDARFVLYAHVEPAAEGAKPDADIWVYDTQTKTQTPVVKAPGYDGGPFFSPDAKWICYRSDRKGDDKLQLFVAELKYENGAIAGIEKEYQLTSGEDVNWCPFWHPSGKFMVYATSAVGHANYEVFSIGVDTEALKRGEKPMAPERVTHAPGADVLPVFSADGKLMMWTSQRGPKIDGEQKPSSQLWIAEWIDPTDAKPVQ
jgi:hypothetical protein